MQRWDDGKNPLWLLTREEFDQLPDGTELQSISCSKYIWVKGRDYINSDMRFGHLAFGVRDLDNHPQKHLLLQFLLKQ